MTSLTINNFSSANILEKAALNADVAVAATALVLDNNDSIGADDFIIIGALGSPNSEIRQVVSVSGAAGVNVSALSRGHLRFEPVTKLFGNKLTVQRAPNVNGRQPADSAFAAFTGSLISIDTDQLSTLFSDPDGSSDYWYKFVYTNSVTGFSTNLSDSSAARGEGFGNYCSLDDIRQEAGFTRNRNITDDMIDAKRQAAQATINSALLAIYTVPFTDPINPLISDMTARLAAGWLLLEQYGHFDTMNTNNGQKKVDSVTNEKKTGDLDKLQLGALTLLDTTGVSTKLDGTQMEFNGWPNADTAQASKLDDGGDRMFRVGGLDQHDRDY